MTSIRIAQLRESIARRALDANSTPTDARILNVVRTGTVFTVVTEQPGQTFRYGVDSFRIPTPDNTDPDHEEVTAPKLWTVVDEDCGAGLDEVPGMLARATAYARSIA
ncbi:hypothetical protein KYY02_19445 [Streptomyces pimonensis]|uniref:Uncharacterized protein n=1 Tax=Streptomyces pimonensis TaxID=2860288 RepID=A0ABV4J1I2_9ACTN